MFEPDTIDHAFDLGGLFAGAVLPICDLNGKQVGLIDEIAIELSEGVEYRGARTGDDVPEPFTRIVAAATTPFPLSARLEFETSTTRIGSWLGAQDVETGDEEFDETFIIKASDEEQVLAFRDQVAAWRPTVNLLFNNAGIGGGGSIVAGERSQWDKTFAVCWGGVYYNTRAFLPMMLAADRGHIVNTSSVNGFFASLGPANPHTAYSAAKFAVKGFTEALITDLRVNAPHIHASVVMPGHIGTSIAINSMKLHIGTTELDPMMQQMGEMFRDNAPMSAGEAAAVILDAVRRDRWRVLVGADAEHLDEMVRAEPEQAYEVEFFTRSPLNRLG